jgi:hypothetical protein
MWETTASMHFWPWPYRFAVILNLPAALAGIPFYGRAASEVVAGIVSLLLTLPLWYWIGFRFDRTCGAKRSGYLSFWLFLLAIVVSSFSGALYFDYSIDYLLYGAGMWMATALAVAVLTKTKPKTVSADR